MAQDFSLYKFFKNQYLEEAVSRSNSKYVTPTTGIKKSTAEYVTDKRESNAEKETNAMRRPDFEMYDQEDGTRQSYISDEDLMDDEYIQEFQQPKSFDPDTINLVREMLEVADRYHNDLVGGDVTVSSFLDKRSGGTYFKFPHYNGPGPGALFGKEITDRIDRSKAEAKEAALKTYTKFKDYIEDYEISDASPAGVYGNVYLFVMFNNLAEDYSAPKGGTISSQFENINDPALVRARAAKDKMSKLKSNPKPSFDEILDLRDEKGDLERRIKNLYREMESDPDVEAEGGAVADQYGDELNKLEARLSQVNKQIRNYDMNESLNEALNPEVSKKVNSFIKAMAERYDYSEQDAVFAIMAALKQRMMDDMNEGSCGYTPDGEPRNKPAGPKLLKLKERIFNSLKTQ